MTIQTIDSTSNQPIVPVSIVGATSGNGSLGVDITTAEAIVPTDIQSHLQTTIQTHNAVSVAASSWSYGSWVDTDGFDKLAGTLKNDASTSMAFNVQWSHDNGTTVAYDEGVVTSGTPNTKGFIADTKARYARLGALNNDTVAHTVSAWIYLKA